MGVRKTTRFAIFSLLLSLIISSGEGVRLFPIASEAVPVSEAESQAVGKSTAQRYQYAARWLGSPLKQSKASSAKGKNSSGAFAVPARFFRSETSTYA